MRCIAAAAFAFAAGLAPAASQQTNLRRTGKLIEDAEHNLELELAGKVDKERVLAVKESLKGTFLALPKNEHGRLAHQTVRYLLHRFFINRHGWFIKGLEPNGDVFHQDSNVSLSEWVPTYLVSRLEERMQNRGMDLDELAALAATIEDVATEEVHERITKVYEAMEVPTDGKVSRARAAEILDAYLVVHLLGTDFKYENKEEEELYMENFPSVYANWDVTQAWLREVEGATLGEASNEQEVGFAEVEKVAVDVGERYATFNDQECSELKKLLVGMTKKAGRVRLSDFYNMSLYSHWRLAEKAEYLDALGALERSGDSKDPFVIVPNYLASRPNCAEPTEMYDVCCRNECEDLMGKVENEFQAPTADPQRLIEFVEGLSSSSSSGGGQKLSEDLTSKLTDVAKLHGGEVIIHGRLFAQFMHHAFPTECPFPHEAGTVDPLTPDEWMGKELTVSEDDRRKYVEDACAFDEGADSSRDVKQFHDLPWSQKEELLEPTLLTPETLTQKVAARAVYCLMVVLLVAALVSLVHPTTSMKLKVFAQGLRQKVPVEALAVLALMTVAAVLKLLDMVMIVFVVMGTLFYVLTPAWLAPRKAKAELVY